MIGRLHRADRQSIWQSYYVMEAELLFYWKSSWKIDHIIEVYDFFKS